MCMTEQSELAYQAMDETAEWGAKNIIHLRRVHELEPHVMPEAPIRPIHLRIAMVVLRVRMIAHEFVVFWSFAQARQKALEFIEVFRLYAKHHNPIYAARMAYGIVIKQLPF